MRKFEKNSIVTILVVSFVLGFIGPISALAATTPSLGAASTYAILSSTYTNTASGTTVNGDVGFTTGSPVRPAGVQVNYGSGAPYSTAGTDQGSALSTGLANQLCTTTFPDSDINLSTDTTGHSIGVYPPGVYCTRASRAASLGSGFTLSGAGTYIFRIDGALTSAPGAIITLTGASACDVFWTPTGATSLAANNTFKGTVIDAAGITVGANTTWDGRALAFGGTVITDTNTITAPAACSAQPPYGGSRQGTINVVKMVINDNGGTKTVADFPLFVNGTLVVSGVTNTFRAPAAAYTITETSDPRYTRTFSGDCDINGQIGLSPGDNKFCIITNNDIGAPAIVPPVPPLIDVVKVPSPLALPNGPGPVTYTYTLRNIGTVPVSNITMVGDTCSPIVLISGDTNADQKLNVNETWIYRCTTTLSATHTNTVTATGWANGITAVDIASATVVVGLPIVPPLIHVTKIPKPLALTAPGETVTYTETVTNPGTVPLSNVLITDDKCAPLKYISGDANGDSKLDANETWVYTCLTKLTKTTTNTVTASGQANGLTATDFAIATVVVSVPGLPHAGLPPQDKGNPWNNSIPAGILLIVSASLMFFLRKEII